MNMLIDDTSGFRYHRSQPVRGEVRHYYLAEPPYLAIVVCRHGLQLPELLNTVVDVALGYDKGYEGFCERGYEGQRHSKATIHRITDAKHKKTLSQFLADSYRD